jgi:hypothetical protein
LTVVIYRQSADSIHAGVLYLVLSSRVMRTDGCKELFALSMFAMVVFLGVGGGLVAGCGDSGDSEPSVGRTLASAGPPPLDLSAPDTYQTATFGFG